MKNTTVKQINSVYGDYRNDVKEAYVNSERNTITQSYEAYLEKRNRLKEQYQEFTANHLKERSGSVQSQNLNKLTAKYKNVG